MSIQLELKLKDITWLGKGFEQKSKISPFTYIKVEGFSEEDKKELNRKGILNKGNEISAKYLPLLQAIAHVESYVEISFSNGPILAKKIVFFSGVNTISLAILDDEFIFEMPANVEGLVNYLKEYIGSSNITNSNLNLEVDSNTALVFSTISDIYKKEILKSYIDNEDFIFNGITKEKIIKEINNLRANEQNISYYIYEFYSKPIKFTQNEIENAINSLQNEGIIVKKDSLIYPINEGAFFAGSFLIIENLLKLTVCQEYNNNIFTSHCLIIQAGIQDLALIEKSNKNISLECLSSYSILNIIKNLLTSKPDITK